MRMCQFDADQESDGNAYYFFAASTKACYHLSADFERIGSCWASVSSYYGGSRAIGTHRELSVLRRRLGEIVIQQRRLSFDYGWFGEILHSVSISISISIESGSSSPPHPKPHHARATIQVDRRAIQYLSILLQDKSPGLFSINFYDSASLRSKIAKIPCHRDHLARPTLEPARKKKRHEPRPQPKIPCRTETQSPVLSPCQRATATMGTECPPFEEVSQETFSPSPPASKIDLPKNLTKAFLILFPRPSFINISKEKNSRTTSNPSWGKLYVWC
jgi:hypothetical protein